MWMNMNFFICPWIVFTHNTSNTECVWFFFPHANQFWHQLDVLHFNSDTNYPKLAFRAQFHKTVPTSDTSPKYRILKLPMLLSNLATSLRFPITIPPKPHPPCKFQYLLEQHTEHKKMLYLLLSVCCKVYNSGTAKRKRCIGQATAGWRGGTELPCFLQEHHPPRTLLWSPTWKLSKSHCSKCL